MSAKRDRLENASPLRRILQNTAWLLGGKGFGAVCGLIYLAILTRTLGLKDFGHFSLIFGTAQALIALAGFQTWRVVVRYGSEHVHAEDWDKFGRLGMLCGMLDAAGAVFGCALAAIVIYGFAGVLDLNPAYIDTAFYFSCASLWALVSAPTGVVRALHRFDMAVYVEAVVPTGRLIAAVAILLTGPSVGRFLFAWAAIDILEAVLYWIMARRLCPQAVRLSNLMKWRQAFAENEGVGRFFMVTYASATIDATMKNGPLLAVGAFISTRAAGLYRLASQLSQALSKLSTLLTRSVYAEVARARVSSELAEFRKLAFQTSAIAGIAGLAVVAIALVAGRQLLQLIAGPDFEQGATILVPLAIAASFDLASVAFEPVLHSTGRARLALVARLLAVVGLGFGLYLFIPTGAAGAAWAVALGGAISYLAMGLMAWRTLQLLERKEIRLVDEEHGSTAG
jgi:O-antigen/teichoic acid export membrane protein